MAYLSVTCEDINLIEEFKKCNVQEIQLALKDCTFSACQSFTVEEIKQIVLDSQMDVAVNMNRLFHEDEIIHQQKILDELIQAGVKCVTVSDFGLLQHAIKQGYIQKMNYDSQFLMTNSLEAKAYLDLGIGYITVSSCLTKQEIITLLQHAANTSLIIHGHLLMSVSKRQLLSAYGKTYHQAIEKGKRYNLQEEKRDAFMPAIEKEVGMMIYTDFIQESFLEIGDFIQAGLKKAEIHTEFLPQEMILDTIDAYQRIIVGDHPEMIRQQFLEKYKEYPIENGYYEQATIR